MIHNHYLNCLFWLFCCRGHLQGKLHPLSTVPILRPLPLEMINPGPFHKHEWQFQHRSLQKKEERDGEREGGTEGRRGSRESSELISIQDSI